MEKHRVAVPVFFRFYYITLPFPAAGMLYVNIPQRKGIGDTRRQIAALLP